MSKFLPKDEILSIKSVDLFTYLKTCFPSELQLFCNGTYTTKTHSSLKISNGLWHYFKEGIGGKNAVDYLVKVENYDFLSACNKVKNDMNLKNNISLEEIEEQEKWNTPRVEYYPSGRVKSYSDGPFETIYEDKDINFIELENFVKNIEKEVEEYIKTKDEETGYSISINLNEGMGSNISIYSLNKNLTSEEKKKLQELQVRIEKCHEKASQIWGAQ